MEIPKTFVTRNKKYFFVKQYKDFARYQTEEGLCECFSFHELGMIEETERDPKMKRPENVKV